MSHVPYPRVPSALPDRLLPLVRRVANGDRDAFGDLHAALCSEVSDGVRCLLPSPVDADPVTAATFVEVWWMARFHATAGSDVSGWIGDIVTRRAAERVRGQAANGHRLGEPGSAGTVQDQGNKLALVALLRQPRPGPRRITGRVRV